MDLSELPSELVERGVWWQVAGFAIVSAASVAILIEFDGSEARAYRYHEAAVKTMYWANVFVLIGLFEGARKMFEKASTLRARYREQYRQRDRQKMLKRIKAQIEEDYASFGTDADGMKVIPITPELQRLLDGGEEEAED